MGRHKNPRYNRKRLVVAGTAAVTVFGAMVGIGIYGSALADQDQRRAANASQACLPPPPTASAPPSSTTTEPPPSSDTAPPETEPTETATETATDTATDTATEPPMDTATDTATDTSAPEDPMGFGGDQLVSLNGDRGDRTPPDYGGPRPPEQAPAAPRDGTMRKFGGENCQDPLGPFPQDFIDIRKVRPSNLNSQPRVRRGGSSGTFTVDCGRNENGHNNSANMIAAPGNVNGAQHTHDYVGNLTTDGFSDNESLAAGGTTCTNGDKSAYFWPIIRVRNAGSTAVDPLNAHNVGDPLLPASVKIQFRGNPTQKVTPAPQFLRILTGDAKSSTNGGANANAKWTCTGFENRITTKYPLCPRGSQTVRIADFPGCTNGETDSANHRTHLAFANRVGRCPEGFQPMPQLRITLKYDIPRGKVFALDAFPDEKHNPLTDHNDFVNVMGEDLMNRVVRCINTGRRC
ncbi:DUF1996 domain-containing protein [Actinophytocola sp. NPDC049390]|uniref:DUF1996 domain-containing protein n=1 Tax=Actinophytocola sp. NPDC049390 TaxID=3363894 RepID=UPI00378B2D6B